MVQLNQLPRGAKARILSVRGTGAFRKRILEMGFVQGQIVESIAVAPLGDPTMYRIMGYLVSLRADEAKLVDVEPIAEDDAGAADLGVAESAACPPSGVDAAQEEADLSSLKSASATAGKPQKTIRVALVGNPNSGKTSLFNLASGAREHTGNYSGVTVDSRTAHINFGDYRIELTDLPGTYSLTAYSPEELFVRNHIFTQRPDLIINVVDTTNLERNLYLTLQLLETGAKVLLALNMWDEFAAAGHRINRPMLAEQLGAPCVPTVGRSGEGLPRLLRTVIDLHEGRRQQSHSVIEAYQAPLREAVERVERQLPQQDALQGLSRHYVALKLIEDDRDMRQQVAQWPNGQSVLAHVEQETKQLATQVGSAAETYATDARYAFIAQLIKRVCAFAPPATKTKFSERIDAILTSRLWGLPIFFGLMWLMFFVTFYVGEFPKGWIEDGVAALIEYLSGAVPSGALRDLLVDGVIGGVGSVIVFLPQIVILFLCIALLEDSGYMARAVFLMDRLMRMVGLHGRAFIPMLMGFGCNVPSIMATRTIQDRKVRLTTMLVNPFMSCSARLQAYVLIVGAIFPQHQVTALFSLYLFGLVVAVLVARLFRGTFLRGNESPFVMELPPYRMPTARASLLMMWSKASQYLRKMGGVILVASVAIWFLSYYPRPTSEQQSDAGSLAAAAQIAEQAEGLGVNDTLALTSQAVGADISSVEDDDLTHSYLARMGKAIEPALLPLGFDWRIGVGLLSGVAAKEVVVSTLGVILRTGDGEEGEALLKERLKTVRYDSGPRVGQVLFTSPTALSLLLFVALYVPCIATVAAIRKESGSWLWALFSAVYTTAVAYVVSLLVYQIGSLL